ncbi:hypothetical protein CDAR_38631 [Caerostris darwini]|uniref:Uncharacterized protein n=1 Tax=Caerostris darwini TaxID=1538125 RepID=A0AAV4UQM7_9ARAC|nr:hypothetical protein CDAR_38631 [Caerostris darwini]
MPKCLRYSLKPLCPSAHDKAPNKIKGVLELPISFNGPGFSGSCGLLWAGAAASDILRGKHLPQRENTELARMASQNKP